MKGSIRRDNRGTEPRYWVVIDDPNGGPEKRKRKWLGDPATGTAFRTKKEAQNFLNQLLHELQSGAFVQPTKQTLGEFLLAWQAVTKVQLKDSTAASYEKNLRLHVIPRLGRLPLQSLTASHLDGLYAQLLDSGRVGGSHGNAGSGLSPRTVKYVHTIVKKALAYAVRTGLLRTNPAELATPPKVQRDSDKVKAWTAHELNSFYALISGQELEPLFRFYAATGARRGEALALTWRDVDLERGTATIRASVGKVRGKVTRTTPKTSSGARRIDLDAATVELLAGVKSQQDAARQQLGVTYLDSGLVFCEPDGSVINPERPYKAFTRLVKPTALPDITLHGLRHTHATLLLAGGVSPRVVQERLGHSSVATTLSLYGHVLPGQQAAAAELFAATLEQAAAGNVTALRRRVL